MNKLSIVILSILFGGMPYLVAMENSSKWHFSLTLPVWFGGSSRDETADRWKQFDAAIDVHEYSAALVKIKQAVADDPNYWNEWNKNDCPRWHSALGFGAPPRWEGFIRPHALLRAFVECRCIDLDAQDSNGQTALMHAVQGHTIKKNSLFATLIELGASVNMRDAKGQTALTLMEGPFRAIFPAEVQQYLSIPEKYKLLVEAGADLQVVDCFGRMPLMRVALFDDYNSFREILIHSHPTACPTAQALRESQQQIMTFLLCLKRNYPHLPRDVRKLILYADNQLKAHALRCPMGICKEFAYLMPLKTVRAFIANGLLNARFALEQLVSYKIDQLKPLVHEASACAPAESFFKQRGPDQIDVYYGLEMKKALIDYLQCHDDVFENDTAKNDGGFIGKIGNCSIQ